MANIFSTIIAAESGGKNINNGLYNGGQPGADGLRHTASGYFQINDSTWMGTTAGANSGYTRAIDAPFATQQSVAAELISKNGLKDWAPYDGINPNVSSYDQTLLSGPDGSTGGLGASAFSPGAASGADSAAQTGVGTQSATSAGFSPGAASGADADAALNPATVPLAITSSQKADDQTSTKNTDATNKTNTQNTNSIVNVIKAFYNSGHAALGDTLFRVALILVGTVILLGALWIVASETGAAPAPGPTLRKAGKKLVEAAALA